MNKESSLQNDLSAIEIETGTHIQNSVIWLHGLGADGSDFVSIVPALQLPHSMGVRFIFPHAPLMPITINEGLTMRAWYDIYGLTIDAKIDKEGMEKSISLIHKLVEKEIQKGIPTERIILAGFSQGAVIALMMGLNYPKRLGGIIALSGYLPDIPKPAPIDNAIRIFLAHGTDDLVVPYALGKMAYATLNAAHYPVTWKSYPMSHSVCAEEIIAIGEWLQSSLY